jgi:hypothetical protein
MDGTGDYVVKQSKLGSEGQKSHFLPMWKLDLRDRYLHKYKHDLTQKMFLIVGLFERTKEAGQEKRMIESE